MCARWPIWSVLEQLAACSPLWDQVCLSSCTTCSLNTQYGETVLLCTFVLNWSGSAMRPKVKHIPSLLLLNPRCTKDHNVAAVERTGDQYT